MPNFDLWTGIQIVLILFIGAWFFKSLKLGEKHQKRMEKRYQEQLSKRRFEVSEIINEQRSKAEAEQAKK